MLMFLPLFLVIYLLSSMHLEIVVLWFPASCLILSSPGIAEALVVNWGGAVFPYHTWKLLVLRPEKLSRPDILLLAMLSPAACFCWAYTAPSARKWRDIQDCSQSPDLFLPFPHAWYSRDTKPHLQTLVGQCGWMALQVSVCDINIELWSLSWGVSLLFGTVFCLHHVCVLPHTTGFFVHAFCWPVYWEARVEVQLNVKGKMKSGSAEMANKPEKQGESGEWIKKKKHYLNTDGVGRLGKCPRENSQLHKILRKQSHTIW